MYSTVTTKETVRELKAAAGFISVNHETQNRINRLHTYETFDVNPVTSKLAGGAATGTELDVNIMNFGSIVLEYSMLGTQTILAPVLTAVGLDINMDQTNNDGVEITHGITAKSRHSYIIGTDGPFFFRVKMKVEDVSGTDMLAVGFRKTQAYANALATYTDKATLNVISGDIKIQTLLNNAGGVVTDTTMNWADGETHTLQVNVSSTGVVTYKVDGAAPTVTAAFTFDTGDVVVPFVFFLNDADVAGKVEVSEWEVGLGT